MALANEDERSAVLSAGKFGHRTEIFGVVRLRGLAARGVVTKDSEGHWRLTADLAGEEARPMEALSSS